MSSVFLKDCKGRVRRINERLFASYSIICFGCKTYERTIHALLSVTFQGVNNCLIPFYSSVMTNDLHVYFLNI